MSGLPTTEVHTEYTTTVVIGSGLPGLAVASELSRQGVSSIVVEGLLPQSAESCRRPTLADSALRSERNDLLRLLQGYATSHSLDIRHSTFACGVSRSPGKPKWVIRTERGLLVADSVVLTGCAQNQMRRLVRNLGIAAGENLAATLRAIGLYLVGVADLLAPSTRDIIRQAKVAGKAIATTCRPAVA